MMASCGALNVIPALALVGRFPLPRASLNACALALGWMAVTTLEMLGAGGLGWLRPWPLAGLSLVVAVIVAALGRPLLRQGMGCLACSWRAMRHGAKAAPAAACLLAAVATVVLTRQLVHIWFLPPYVYDALVYHLPRVADWVREGRLVMPNTPVLRCWWPANFELLQAWVAVFFHHDALVELPGLVPYAAAMGGVFALSRAASLTRRQAAGLALACALTPAILMQAVSCKNDLAVTAVYVWLLAVWIEADRDAGPDPSRLFWSVVAVAWGVGVKPYLVPMVAGLLPLFGWILWQRHRAALPIMGAGSRSDRRWLLMAAVAVAPLAGFWYARNVLLFGNPLYPVAATIGPWHLPGMKGLYQQGSFSLHSLASTTRALVGNKLWDAGQPFNPELGNMAGWGWFVVVCGIPLSALALRDAWFRRLALTFGLSFALLFGSVNPDPWNMRFALWAPVLFVVGVGIALREMVNPDIRRAFIWLAALMCLLNVVGTLNNGYYRHEEWRAQRRRPLEERSPMTGWDVQMARLPIDAVVAYRMGDNDPLYLLYGPSLRRRPVFLPTIRDGDDLRSQMMAAGAKWLFLLTPTEEEGAAIADLVRRGLLRKVSDGLYRQDG